MTQRVQLEQRLLGEIARELASRGRFKVQASAEGADAVLTGAVLGFNLFPVAFDAQGRATDYQVQVTARVSLKTLPDRKVLWENRPTRSATTTPTPRRPRPTSTWRTTPSTAWRADFAQALVTSMLEGF
jgi:hypothetical protein